ncbi:hypothetical protein L1887_32581 [Cichorium endivia]|nr:hypothetical protein L1887_32581 [Cichorium endivia]
MAKSDHRVPSKLFLPPINLTAVLAFDQPPFSLFSRISAHNPKVSAASPPFSFLLPSITSSTGVDYLHR